MAGLFRLLLLVGFVVKFWWLILLLAAIMAAEFGLWVFGEHQVAEFNQRSRAHYALIARADEQHAQVLAGDDRGIYGAYPPHEGISLSERNCCDDRQF